MQENKDIHINPSKKLSVVIVSYNVKYFLEQCLNSVLKSLQSMKASQPDWDTEVWVVDNKSVDGSAAMVRERFPWVRLIANNDNKGFSAANNQAIRAGDGEHVLLLNPDTVIEENTLLKCVEFMEDHPEAGGLGVKMLDGKGKFLPESKRGFPAPDVAFYKIFGLSGLFPKSRVFGKYHLGYLSDEETNKIDVLSGAFMLLRGEALKKVGLLDETFFMYGEDIDLSYRIKQAGYENYYFPHTRIIHYKGESTKKDSVNYVFVFYRAMVIFAKKHLSHKNAQLFSLLINMAIYLRAGISVLIRFIRSTLHPLIDYALTASALMGGMYWYATAVKYAESGQSYPSNFFNIILPIYAAIWVFSIQLNGGYHFPFRLARFFRGTIYGTVAVAVLYAFLDNEYRYSRGIILVGTAVMLIVGLLSRFLTHLIKEGNLSIGKVRQKRIVIIGSKEEGSRVSSLLQESGIDYTLLGFLSPANSQASAPGYLGSIRQLSEVVDIHKANELIFCSKDLSSAEIFNWMLKIQKEDVFFKIVPEESLFIIGSNSKNQKGDYYTIDVSLALKNPETQYQKRLADVLSSMALLLTLPLNLWFVRNKPGYMRNLWAVLVGSKSWVGYSAKDSMESLPNIKKGVLGPEAISRSGEHQINFLYAKDYSPLRDLEIIWRGFGYLGG